MYTILFNFPFIYIWFLHFYFHLVSPCFTYEIKFYNSARTIPDTSFLLNLIIIYSNPTCLLTSNAFQLQLINSNSILILT